MAKTPKRKKPRTRLPAYSQLQRERLLAEMQANPLIPSAVTNAVMDSVNAAANKDAENPLVVIASLEREDRESVQRASQGYQQTLSAVGMRGRMALMMDLELDSIIASQEDE